MKRRATAVWAGSGKGGNGHLSTQSGTLERVQYSFTGRFAEGTGTNPEELIAAAHAGCFTMKLSFVLGEMGLEPDELSTECVIAFENGVIAASHLCVSGRVVGATAEQFAAAVADAEQNCPVSRVLNASITSEATLLA